MIEFFSIILSSVTIFSLFNGNNIFFDFKTNKNIFKKIVISLIIIFNIFLFFSFLPNGINYLIYLIFILVLLNLISFLKNLFNFTFLLFLILNFVLFLQIASNPILGWDGQAIWYAKAYNYFNGGNFLNLSEFTKSNYPHLGGYIWAIFWKISFLNYEYLGRFVYIFTFLSSLFFINSYNKNIKIKNILITYSIFLICFDLDIFRGYQEYLIFSFLNIYIILHYNEKNQKSLFFLALLIINIIVWIKNEGLIYSFPIFALYVLKQKRILCKENLFFLILYSLIICFRLYLSTTINQNFNFHGNDFSFGSITKEIFNFTTFGSDFIIIMKHFIISYFKYPIWIFLFIFLIFPESSIKRKKIYHDTILIFIFSFLINFLIFHIQRTDILEWHLSAALDRLNLILAGYFVYFIYCNINNYLDKFLFNE